VVAAVDKSLRKRGWTEFEISNLKLYYLPYYVFNYDLLIEEKVRGQEFSQGSSGSMGMDAVSGKIEPIITELLDSQPVSFEKKVSHDISFEAVPPAMTLEEVKDAAARRIAGQFNVGHESVKCTGFRLFYWPVWRVFISMPQGFYRLDIEGFSGVIFNENEIPVRPKTWQDTVSDTISLLKSPKGWVHLLSSSFRVVSGLFKGLVVGRGSGILSDPRARWVILFLLLAIVLYWAFA